MKSNVITIGAKRLFNILKNVGKIKPHEGWKVENVIIMNNGWLSWFEGGLHKTYDVKKIVNFFERDFFEVYNTDGKFELLMWDEKTLDT